MRDLADILLKLINGQTVFAGVGNSLKGDDGAGPYFIEKIKNNSSLKCINCENAPENYIEKIVTLNPQTLIIIDATELGESLGTIRLLKTDELESLGLGTHNISLNVFTSYIENRIKGIRIYILAIQPKQCLLGHSLSAEVENSINTLLKMLNSAN